MVCREQINNEMEIPRQVLNPITQTQHQGALLMCVISHSSGSGRQHLDRAEVDLGFMIQTDPTSNVLQMLFHPLSSYTHMSLECAQLMMGLPNYVHPSPVFHMLRSACHHCHHCHVDKTQLFYLLCVSLWWA